MIPSILFLHFKHKIQQICRFLRITSHMMSRKIKNVVEHFLDGCLFVCTINLILSPFLLKLPLIFSVFLLLGLCYRPYGLSPALLTRKKMHYLTDLAGMQFFTRLKVCCMNTIHHMHLNTVKIVPSLNQKCEFLTTLPLKTFLCLRKQIVQCLDCIIIIIDISSARMIY